MLLLRAEGYLQMVRVNIATSAKKAGFKHLAQGAPARYITQADLLLYSYDT